MVKTGSIFQNPVIPQGFYFAKVLEVETEEVGKNRPLLWVKLSVAPFYDSDAWGAVLTCIIHPVETADKYHWGFISSFGLFETPHDYKKAIGQWASIGIYDSKYQHMKYSAVRFYCPSPDTQKQVMKVAALDDDGEIQW